MQKKLTAPFLVLEGGHQDADLRHLCGFTAPDPVVLLVHGVRKYLVVSLLEFGRAKTTAKVTDVWTPQQLELTGPARGRLEDWALALVKKLKLKRVTVGRSFPVGVADYLRRHKIVVTVADQSLVPARRVKTKTEIRHITLAQRAAVKAMRAAIDTIRSAKPDPRDFLILDGRRLRAEDVRRVIDRVLLDHDCFAADTIVAGGAQGADPHERGHGPLRAGVPIVIDIFPRHKGNGYWGDITRTVVNGDPKSETARMYNAVLAAQQAALAKLKAGIQVKQVHQAAMDTLVAHGFETTVKNGWGEGFIHSTGHGIGLEIHEAPSINLSDTRLKVGDVVTAEPGLYYKKWGGIRIEDTVVITRDGYRLLVACPKKYRC